MLERTKALATIAVVVVTALEAVPAVPIATESLVALLALLLLVLVLFRLADPPDVTFLESTAVPGARSNVESVDRAAGAWLGLIATLGMFGGGLIAMRDERRSPAGRHTDLSGAPVDSPPEVETLSAPRAEASS